MMKTAVFPRSYILSSILIAAVAVVLLMPANAGAGDFQRKRDDHPLALLRYALYPVGALLEYTVFRPAHQIVTMWLPEEGCFSSAFGCDTARKHRQRYRAARR